MPPLHPLHAQLANSLLARHNLPVSATWLTEFLSTRGPNAPPPLPALTSTAQFRVLASDIRTSLSPTPADLFPAGVDDVNVKDRRLEGTVVVQVLDVVDIGSSKWSQVEAIERVERGEEIRGREVIRSVAEDGPGVIDGSTAGGGGNVVNNTAAAATSATGSNLSSTAPTTAKKLSTGPHKLLIQDAKGTQVLAFELIKIPKIALSISASAVSSAAPAAAAAASFSSLNQGQQSLQIDDPGMFIGCKLLLKPGTSVRRGVVMLRPEDCVVLGGKVEAWDKKWKAERKARLTALVEEGSGGGHGDGDGAAATAAGPG